MSLKFIKKLLLIAAFFYLPFSAAAWGVIGHRVVGQIAEGYLTPNAKKAVAKILGTESMAMSSTWSDFIRSDSAFAYLNPWHYINFKVGMSMEEVSNYLEKDTVTDVYTKLNFLIQQLKNKNVTPASQQLYLRMLIHMVGDIHQPLHAGHAEDLGGNKVKVVWFGAPSNLHKVWDEQLINFQQLSYTEYTTAINHCTAAQRANWQSQGIKTWIFDAYTLADKIYNDVKPDEKLDYLYNFKFIGVVNNQLLKAGVHLAGVLNSIFTR